MCTKVPFVRKGRELTNWLVRHGDLVGQVRPGNGRGQPLGLPPMWALPVPTGDHPAHHNGDDDGGCAPGGQPDDDPAEQDDGFTP